MKHKQANLKGFLKNQGSGGGLKKKIQPPINNNNSALDSSSETIPETPANKANRTEAYQDDESDIEVLETPINKPKQKPKVQIIADQKKTPTNGKLAMFAYRPQSRSNSSKSVQTSKVEDTYKEEKKASLSKRKRPKLFPVEDLESSVDDTITLTSDKSESIPQSVYEISTDDEEERGETPVKKKTHQKQSSISSDDEDLTEVQKQITQSRKTIIIDDEDNEKKHSKKKTNNNNNIKNGTQSNNNSRRRGRTARIVSDDDDDEHDNAHHKNERSEDEQEEKENMSNNRNSLKKFAYKKPAYGTNKRNAQIIDSDSELENSPVKNNNTAVIEIDDSDGSSDSDSGSGSDSYDDAINKLLKPSEKGYGLQILEFRKQFPSQTKENIEAVIAAGESRREVMQLLKENSQVLNARRKLPENRRNNNRKGKNKVVNLSDYENSDSEDEEETSESEDGIDTNEDITEGEILKYFQDSNVSFLQRIPTCSLKRSEIIVSLRPFSSYKDLARKLDETKGISSQILEYYCEMVHDIRVMESVIQRCHRKSKDMRVKCEDLLNEENQKEDETDRSDLKLKSYQVLGVNWIYLLYKNQSGGILADEMGLGKTVQALSFLRKVVLDEDPGPHLVVVPSSCADNWIREARKWCSNIQIIQYFGSLAERRSAKIAIQTAEGSTIVITTYNICSGKNDRGFFKKQHFSCVILDEGHMLKNMGTLRYCEFMQVNSDFRLLLTGTPLQNTLLELMSLLYFINTDMFGKAAFEILHKHFKDVKTTNEEDDVNADLVAKAQTLMKPFILRRTKNEVLTSLALPPKTEEVIKCGMTKMQLDLYAQIVASAKAPGFMKDQKLNNVMMQLRKAANHPLLHRTKYDLPTLRKMAKSIMIHEEYMDNNEEYIFEDMEVMSDFELHALCGTWAALNKYQLDPNVMWESGKLNLLKNELLPKLKKEGHRVLLFSQFTMMLDIIETCLKETGYKTIRLDGQTAVADRLGIIDKFHNDEEIFIFLASTKAGGVGINLTAANVVILHDIDFNPHNDAQACARVHRLGQTKKVQVIKLLSENSVETIINDKAIEKLELEKQVTNEDLVGQSGDRSKKKMVDDLSAILEIALNL